jgi:diguanylate cyclase (GGDEF)-like protein
MRKEKITYAAFLRRLLGTRLLRADERRLTEQLLAVPDLNEVGRRVGEILETVSERGDLIRLGAREDDRPTVRRYLDPLTNDRWSVELPGPRPVPARPAAAAPTRAPAPERAAEKAAAQATQNVEESRPEPAPPAPAPAPVAPKLVLPIELIAPEPAIAPRFQDATTGEPLRTLFSSFSPCRTPEDLGEALGLVRDQVLARTSATDVRFFLHSEGGASPHPVPIRGQGGVDFIPLGERVRHDVLEGLTILHVPNLSAHGTAARDGDRGALVSLPLVSAEQVTGLMEVSRSVPGPFEADELRFFALTALVSAGILTRAEVLEKLIFVDKLTGLYNRAYFDDQLEREIERANRGGTSVALMMADLDHFKKINDTYGHQAGDLALAHLAGIIKANIRQIDVAARYGGEEFAILLPSITRARAVRTAERLRRVVADTKFGEFVGLIGDARLSLSVGVALYPDDAATSKQLIDRADRVALYAAKNRGRNRVVSWAAARESKGRLLPSDAADG